MGCGWGEVWGLRVGGGGGGEGGVERVKEVGRDGGIFEGMMMDGWMDGKKGEKGGFFYRIEVEVLL